MNTTNLQNTTKIRCRKCLNLLEIKFFSPQERIADGKSHICNRCEKDLDRALFDCNLCGDNSGRCKCFLEI